MGKNLSNKYIQKLLDSSKNFYKGCNKTASKRAIQKTAEEIGDLIGNKITDKITSVSTELHWKSPTRSKTDDANNEIEVSKKRYISPEDNKLLMN